MTLPRLYALSDYWREHPPTHLLIAGFLGYKSKPKENEEPELDDLISAFTDAGIREK